MKSHSPEKGKKVTDRPTPRRWNEMNRQQRRETMRKIQSNDLHLEVVHPDAAGIDIGNESHYVAVPPDRDAQPVRCFGCTTVELREMAQWLKQCGIRTVAMQSTGVYWIAVYDMLEEAGFEVYLVNARDTKNLPGRKSDVQESQCNDLVQSAARHIQRMQKSLAQMNFQLANVLSDVRGVTGQAIIQAILAGERDPHRLAALRDPRLKASEEQIARYLEATGEKICCLCSSRSSKVTSFARSRSPSATGSSSSISSSARTAAPGLLCLRRRGGVGSRRGGGTSRSSTCARSYFA